MHADAVGSSLSRIKGLNVREVWDTQRDNPNRKLATLSLCYESRTYESVQGSLTRSNRQRRLLDLKYLQCFVLNVPLLVAINDRETLASASPAIAFMKFQNQDLNQNQNCIFSLQRQARMHLQCLVQNNGNECKKRFQETDSEKRYCSTGLYCCQQCQAFSSMNPFQGNGAGPKTGKQGDGDLSLTVGEYSC